MDIIEQLIAEHKGVLDCERGRVSNYLEKTFGLPKSIATFEGDNIYRYSSLELHVYPDPSNSHISVVYRPKPLENYPISNRTELARLVYLYHGAND